MYSANKKKRIEINKVCILSDVSLCFLISNMISIYFIYWFILNLTIKINNRTRKNVLGANDIILNIK